MDTAELQRVLKRKVCDEIEIEQEGLDRYIVYTPFMFDDGDHFVVVLKKNGTRWCFTDEGHTFMHMSYGEVDVSQGPRRRIVDQILQSFRLDNREGELSLDVPGDQYGDGLFSFVQALVKISDTTYWTTEQVRSTFVEDFRAMLEERIPKDRRTFDYCDKQHDPEEKYAVDCRINGMTPPLLVFGIPNDNKCRDATITLMKFEQWGERFRSLAIYADQEQIGRRVLARFSDVIGKQLPSLSDHDRIEKYLDEVLRDSSNA